MEWCEKRKSAETKSKCVTDFLLTVLRVWRIILVITRTAHKRQTLTLISIKLMWILKFLYTHNRVFKHKGIVSNLHVCCNGLGKMCVHTYFTFLQRIHPPYIWKNLIFFFIIYVAMSNIHFSGLDNIKMTCQAHKY